MLTFLALLATVLAFVFTFKVFMRTTAFTIVLLIVKPTVQRIPYGLVSLAIAVLSFLALYAEVLWIIEDVKELLAL